MYQRSALVFDTPDGPLSGLALSLISLGLTPHYSADLDELVLLSREYGPRIGAILVPADVVEKRLLALFTRVVEPLGLSASVVVPIGSPPEPEALEALAKQGLRFALRPPFEAADLRFVVAQVLSNSDPEELRLHARVPCTIPVQIESALRRAEATLTDLSPGGGFARIEESFPRNARIRLHCPLSGGRVTIACRVAWVTGPDTPEWHDVGMGIEFLEIPEDGRLLLARDFDERVGRYLL